MYEINEILYADDKPQMIKVTKVKVLDKYCLELTFNTGEIGIYDAQILLHLPVFQKLKDKTIFQTVSVDFDTIVWLDGEIDIAPETLYMNCRFL